MGADAAQRLPQMTEQDPEDAWMDPIRHQAVAGNPFIVLTDGRHVGRVREALAVTGRLDELRVLVLPSACYGIPLDAQTRQVLPESMPSRNWVADKVSGLTSADERFDSGLPPTEPLERRSFLPPPTPALPSFEAGAACEVAHVLVVVSDFLEDRLSYGLWLLDQAATAARSARRPEPALIPMAFPDVERIDFLDKARDLGFEAHTLIAGHPWVIASPAWAADALEHGDLGRRWAEAVAAHDALNPRIVYPGYLTAEQNRFIYPGLLAIEGNGRTVVVCEGLSDAVDPRVRGIWEIRAGGRCRAIMLMPGSFDPVPLEWLVRRVSRGGLERIMHQGTFVGLDLPRGCDISAHPMQWPVDLLRLAEERAGVPCDGRHSRAIDEWISSLSIGRRHGERIAWTLESDPARFAKRQDFVRTWPALGELLLHPEPLRGVDAGSETVPVVARFLGTAPAIARRLVGLNCLPVSVVPDAAGLTDSHAALGRFLAALGHDHLPTAGDHAGWGGLISLAEWLPQILGRSGTTEAATVRRLLLAIPGRDWTERARRMKGLGDWNGVRDMTRALATWLSAVSGQAAGSEGEAVQIVLGHGSLLRIAQAAHAWHAHPLLRSDTRGLPLDTTWPTPFDPFYLGMGLEAHVLGSVQELIDEGMDGPDSTGLPGLAHCVGGYGRQCQTGESLIVSLRRTAAHGGTRVSTAELVPDKTGAGRAAPVWSLAGRAYRVNQHRGLANAEPPGEAIESLLFLKEALAAGAVPLRPEALDRRPPLETRADARHAACFHPAWRRILPRRYARMSLDELAGVVRVLTNEGARAA